MTSHHWGDKNFDWDSLYKAEEELGFIMEKLGRVGVHSKEKFGTLRFTLFLCDGTIHSLTHPGYCYNQFPKWAWSITMNKKVLGWIAPVVRFWQRQVIKTAFSIVCSKYSHIQDEIIEDMPKNLLPIDLGMRCAKMWSSTCRSCDKHSTTDNYKCPYCGEIK